MKKKILGIIFICMCIHVSAAQSIITNEEGKKFNIESDYTIDNISKLSDLEVAVILNDLNYIKVALLKDPNIIVKINDLKYGDFIGSKMISIEMFNLLLSADPNLLNRKDEDGRNILLSNLTTYFEKINNVKISAMFDDVEKNLVNKNINPKKIIRERNKNSINNYELVLLKMISKMNYEQLNIMDKYKNTALHYAVYNRNSKIIEELLKNKNFKNKKNVFGENPLFMLLERDCNVSKNNDTDIEVLNKLINGGVNILDKNSKGYSFAALILAIDDYKHLQPVVEKEMPEHKKKTIDLEVSVLKKTISQQKQNKIYYGFFSVVNNAFAYSGLSCQNQKD